MHLGWVVAVSWGHLACSPMLIALQTQLGGHSGVEFGVVFGSLRIHVGVRNECGKRVHSIAMLIASILLSMCEILEFELAFTAE